MTWDRMEQGQIGVAILVDGQGVPWLGDHPLLSGPATIEIPTILDGLTMGQALDVVLGDTTYRYQISAVERKPPRYGRKWLTQRALRWKKRHWATTEVLLTLEKA